ncbi:MAG: sodium/glutamate symporter [Leptospiraceae bacterium]
MIALTSLGFICLALAVGMLLYYRVGIFRRYLIQPALIGGVLLLAMGSQGMALIEKANYDAWSSWPGFLISFLFSTLILAAPAGGSRGKPLGAVFFQGGYVWVLALGQIAVGLLIISFFDPRWWVAGHIIEIGWMGGHGSAAALIAVSEDLGQREAAELALFSATIGLIYGSVSGMVLINILQRKGIGIPNHTNAAMQSEQSPGNLAQKDSHGESEKRFSPASSMENDSGNAALLDSNASWLVSLIAGILPVLIAYFFMDLLAELLRSIFPDTASYLDKLPLFFIALLFAFPVRKILSALNLLDPDKARILNSLILEFLIVSAIATLNLGLLLESWSILLALTLGGALWTALCFFWIAPRLLDQHPDLSLINYGMSTGVTALGLLLLRSFRNRIPEEPATVYGLAAPFSAPFIGGGIISLLLPIWTMELGPLSISTGVFSVMIALLGLLLFVRHRLRNQVSRRSFQ